MSGYDSNEINLEQAVDFIQSMIPGIDEDIIEQYLIEYQNVQEVIDLLMANQDSLKNAKIKKSPSSSSKKRNNDKYFGFEDSEEEDEEEPEHPSAFQNYFYNGDEEEYEEDDGEGEGEEYFNDDYFQQEQLEQEQQKKRDEKKRKSEKIFDMEDDDCGDIISMEDIRRSSEEKKRNKIVRVDDNVGDIGKFEALAQDQWFDEDNPSNKNENEMNLLDMDINNPNQQSKPQFRMHPNFHQTSKMKIS